MEWINIEDKSPLKKDLGVEFLCHVETVTGLKHQICEWFNEEVEGSPSHFLIDLGWPQSKKEITHWMPLPEPPKEK